MKRDERKDDFVWKNVWEPSSPQMNQPKMVSKKKKTLSDELFLDISFESSESYRVFNYLHDSNSIFRTGRIKFRRGFGRHGKAFRGPMAKV